MFSVRQKNWKWITRFRQMPGEEIIHSCHSRWMSSHQHAHGHREMLIVLEGNHFYGAHSRLYRALPGSIFLFDHQEPHDRFYSPYQPELRDLWVFFSSPRQALFSEFSLQPPTESDPHSDISRRASFLRRKVISGPFVEAVSSSWDSCARTPASSRSLDQLKASITALLFNAEQLFQQVSAEPEKSREQHRIVAYIREHIRQHPGDPHSLESVARLAGYAPTYFHRMFKAATGERLHAFVNAVRLEAARKFLEEGRSVESVASDLGFATAAYFSRFFKQATGHPPSHWRMLALETSSRSKGSDT